MENRFSKVSRLSSSSNSFKTNFQRLLIIFRKCSVIESIKFEDRTVEEPESTADFEDDDDDAEEEDDKENMSQEEETKENDGLFKCLKTDSLNSQSNSFLQSEVHSFGFYAEMT